MASRTHAGKLRPSPADHSCPSSLHHIVTLILERENQTTLYLEKVTAVSLCSRIQYCQSWQFSHFVAKTKDFVAKTKDFVVKTKDFW